MAKDQARAFPVMTPLAQTIPNGAAASFLGSWPLSVASPATSFARQVSQHLEASVAPVDLEIKPLDLMPHSPVQPCTAPVQLQAASQVAATDEEDVDPDAPRRSASNPLVLPPLPLHPTVRLHTGILVQQTELGCC